MQAPGKGWKACTERRLIRSAPTVSHFVSCHDHISDVMRQSAVIAECRLSCHFSTLGPERQLGICHQDAMFFRAGPQLLVVQKSHMFLREPVCPLINSSSVVPRECGTWSETWANMENRAIYDKQLQDYGKFFVSGLAVTHVLSLSQSSHRVSLFTSLINADSVQSSHHVGYICGLLFTSEVS